MRMSLVMKPAQRHSESPRHALQAAHLVEVSVAAGHCQMMLPAKARNPDVVFRNGRRRRAQLLTDVSVVTGGVSIHRHQCARGFHLLNPSLQLGSLTRPPDAKKEFAQRNDRQVPELVLG